MLDLLGRFRDVRICRPIEMRAFVRVRVEFAEFFACEERFMRVEVLDLQKLKDVSCECYETLRG